MIRINATAPQLRRLMAESRSALRAHRPAFITEAPEAIAIKMGYFGLAGLREVHARAIDFLHNPDTSPEIRAKAWQTAVALSPEDLKRVLGEFLHMQAALKLFASTLRGSRILQLASNYGPYLHFLQQAEGANVAGVDIAKAASAYARERSIDVREGSSASLPFADSEFDFVISKNFLSGDYLMGFAPDHPEHLIPATQAEVHRVLRPGGLFISEREEFVFPRSFRTSPLGEPSCFPEELVRADRLFECFQEFRIFEKTA